MELSLSFETRYSGYGKWWWYTPRHQWLEQSPLTPSHMPAVPACYVLTLDGRAVYVGQTMNLRTRFYSHGIKTNGSGRFLTRWGELHGDLRLKVKFGQRYGDWCMREARLIDRLKPSLNQRLV